MRAEMGQYVEAVGLLRTAVAVSTQQLGDAHFLLAYPYRTLAHTLLGRMPPWALYAWLAKTLLCISGGLLVALGFRSLSRMREMVTNGVRRRPREVLARADAPLVDVWCLAPGARRLLLSTLHFAAALASTQASVSVWNG